MLFTYAHRKQRCLMGMSRRRREMPLHLCHTCRIHSGTRERENIFIYHSYGGGGHLPSACTARIVPRLIDTHWLDGSIQTPTLISQLLNSASSSAVVDFRVSFTETEEGGGCSKSCCFSLAESEQLHKTADLHTLS